MPRVSPAPFSGVTATSAFTEGAQAAAEGVGEPSSVSDCLDALSR